MTETTISLFFKTWTRAGDLYAVPTGIPPTAINNVDHLEHIKNSPFTLEKSVQALNATYRAVGVTEIDIQDLRVALTLSSNTLLNIIYPALN